MSLFIGLITFLNANLNQIKSDTLNSFQNSAKVLGISISASESDASFDPIYQSGVYIDVDLSQQKLRFVSDSKVVKSYPVSSGAPENPTPTGSFKILNRAVSWVNGSGDFLPYWLGFSGQAKGLVTYGFHEVPYKAGQKEKRDFSQLGKPVSSGCVRLSPEGAKYLYEHSNIGTRVEIHQ